MSMPVPGMAQMPHIKRVSSMGWQQEIQHVCSARKGGWPLTLIRQGVNKTDWRGRIHARSCNWRICGMTSATCIHS